MPHLDGIVQLLTCDHGIVLCHDNLVKAILDPSTLSDNSQFINAAIAAARQKCFYMHLLLYRLVYMYHVYFF